MTIRVLLVESQPEDVLFMRDVLLEIESGRYWDIWRPLEILYATTVKGAMAIVARQSVDVILLNPDLSDSQGIATFRKIHRSAARIPIILLVGPEDLGMASRLVRDGAQDFLTKQSIDCAPLAHAIHNAIERQRLLSAAQAAANIDRLTGLIDRGGFMALADRDRKLAESLGRRMMVLIIEPNHLCGQQGQFGEQGRDLALIGAADQLRSLARPTDIVARIGDTRFGMLIFETGIESLEETWARMHSAVAQQLQIGAAIFASERPASLEALLDQAAADLNPTALTTEA